MTANENYSTKTAVSPNFLSQDLGNCNDLSSYI